MLRNISLAALCLLAGVLHAGSLPAQAQSAPPPDENSRLLLQFRPREGEERLIRLHAIQQATYVGEREKSHFRQTITMDNLYRALPAAPDGRARLRVTVRATRYERVVDGKIIESYDSTRPADAAKSLSDNAELFALLPGFHFTVQMNNDGTIGDIEGKEAIAEQMMDKMEVKPESRQYVRPAMLAMLDGNAFKNFGNVFASFPAREVSIGDVWPKRDVVSHDWNLIYDGALTLARRAAGRSTLHLKSVMKPDPQRAKGAHVLPLRGTQAGYYFVEEESGWTQRARLEQRWTGFMDELGQFVAPGTKDSRPLYMKMTFHIGTPSTPSSTP